ncbi:MAG: epoxyqueuosine reductase QueH [Sphaerochaetaceae bacterium]|nr:epoxyqueuosine reductase QueH [Sphaerochaetaceae bacterium]
MGKRILVHCCCGPCATSSIQRLIEEGYEPVLCYGNSNIWPEEENQIRYENLLKVSEHFGGLEVVRQRYDHEAWLSLVSTVPGYESLPEDDARCTKCFEFNLRDAYEEAKRLGIEHFTTTLTVSRFKNSQHVFDVGKNFDGFEQIDFKKKDGFAKSCKMAKELDLYRQQYCGCEFSILTAEEDDGNA